MYPVEPPPTCPALRLNGLPCTGTILMEDGACWAHSATITEDQRFAARKKGGYSGTQLAEIERSLEASPTLLNILRSLGRVADRLEKGEIPAATATGMASLARAMTSVVGLAQQDQRLRALTEMLDRYESGGFDPAIIEGIGWEDHGDDE